MELDLSDARAGDTMLRASGYVYKRLSLVTVDRVTQTQILVGNCRYSKDGGYRVGRGRDGAPDAIRFPTHADFDAVESQSLIDLILSVSKGYLQQREVGNLRAIADAMGLEAPKMPPRSTTTV